jgi:hypothetical protein
VPAKRVTFPALAVVALAAVVASVGVSAAASAPWRVIARTSLSGDFAVALLSARAAEPAGLAVRVVATPRQRVAASWTVVCSVGADTRRASGTFAATTPATRILRLPLRRPDSCVVGAVASTLETGTVRLQILRR